MKLFLSETIKRSSEKKLILFFNGWGMDENPFLSLLPETIDCLIVSDYRTDADNNILKYLQNYQSIHLFSWSMGVWYAQNFFTKNVELRVKLSSALAVNGTLNPIDNIYGISKKLFENMAEEYSELVRDRFYRQMCGRDLDRFKSSQPQRSLEDQQKELKNLLATVEPFKEKDSIYNEVLIASKDLIVPTKSQKNYWQCAHHTILKGGHFPFYNWNNLEEFYQQYIPVGCQ